MSAVVFVRRGAGVARLPAPVALEYPTGSLWLWGELEREPGGVWPTPAMWVPDVASACSGTTSLVTDAAQQPLELVPLSAQEVADNQNRNDGRRLALRPLGGFVADNIGYLFYQELLLGPGFFDEELLATSLCRLGDRRTPCDRAQHEQIWERSRFNWGHAAWLAADDTVYLYGCQRPAAFEDSCSVARAALPLIGQLAAVEYYNFAQGWIADSGNTTVLFEGPSAVTVMFNAHANAFVAVSPNIWDSRFEVRVADEPWGDFRGARLLFDALPPNNKCSSRLVPPSWAAARLLERQGVRPSESLDLTAAALDPEDYRLE